MRLSNWPEWAKIMVMMFSAIGFFLLIFYASHSFLVIPVAAAGAGGFSMLMMMVTGKGIDKRAVMWFAAIGLVAGIGFYIAN